MRRSLVSALLGAAALMTMMTSSLAQEIDGEKATDFGSEGRWDIIQLPGRCFAGTQTSDKSAYLFFELEPKTVVVISSHAWNIPAGDYAVVVEHDGVNGSRSVDNLNAEVDPKNHQVMRMQFDSREEVTRLVEQNWLNFKLGSHEVFFNSGAADAIRVLAVCSRKASDPFATVK